MDKITFAQNPNLGKSRMVQKKKKKKVEVNVYDEIYDGAPWWMSYEMTKKTKDDSYQRFLKKIRANKANYEN